MLEVACLIAGIIILVNGRVSLSQGRVVTGAPARLAGLCLVAPLPVSFGVGFVYGLMLAARGRRIDLDQVQGTMALIELAILAVFVLAFLILVLSNQEDESKRRADRDAGAPVLWAELAPQAEAPAPAARPARPVLLDCEGCGKSLSVPPALFGQNCRCPRCGHVLVVPAPPLVPAAPPESPAASFPREPTPPLLREALAFPPDTVPAEPDRPRSQAGAIALVAIVCLTVVILGVIVMLNSARREPPRDQPRRTRPGVTRSAAPIEKPAVTAALEGHPPRPRPHGFAAGTSFRV
jgi:hypothetical protein